MQFLKYFLCFSVSTYLLLLDSLPESRPFPHQPSAPESPVIHSKADFSAQTPLLFSLVGPHVAVVFKHIQSSPLDSELLESSLFSPVPLGPSPHFCGKSILDKPG